MLHVLGPGQIGNVDQPVDALFDLEESSEIGAKGVYIGIFGQK